MPKSLQAHFMSFGESVGLRIVVVVIAADAGCYYAHVALACMRAIAAQVARVLAN